MTLPLWVLKQTPVCLSNNFDPNPLNLASLPIDSWQPLPEMKVFKPQKLVRWLNSVMTNYDKQQSSLDGLVQERATILADARRQDANWVELCPSSAF